MNLMRNDGTVVEIKDEWVTNMLHMRSHKLPDLSHDEMIDLFFKCYFVKGYKYVYSIESVVFSQYFWKIEKIKENDNLIKPFRTVTKGFGKKKVVFDFYFGNGKTLFIVVYSGNDIKMYKEEKYQRIFRYGGL